MIHIKGDRTEPCLTPDLIGNQLLTPSPTLTAALLFSYLALITLMYFSGLPYKDKTFAKALSSTESKRLSSIAVTGTTLSSLA